ARWLPQIIRARPSAGQTRRWSVVSLYPSKFSDSSARMFRVRNVQTWTAHRAAFLEHGLVAVNAVGLEQLLQQIGISAPQVGQGRILGKGTKQRHRCELRVGRLPAYPHLATRHVPDLLERRPRIADHLGNRAEAVKIGLYLLHLDLARIRGHIDQKTDFWEWHFDFLEQLCAATVES